MSHKVVTEQRTVTHSAHHFYCDRCETYLGKTTEFEDGYYAEIGEFSLAFYTPHGWRCLKKHMCSNCREAYLSELDEALFRFGFTDYNIHEEDR